MSYNFNECNKTLFTNFQRFSDLTYTYFLLLTSYFLPLIPHFSFIIFVNIEFG